MASSPSFYWNIQMNRYEKETGKKLKRFSFGSQAKTIPAEVAGIKVAGQITCHEARAEKETAMNCNHQDTRTEAQQAKDYLIQSLNGEINRKDQEAMRAFGLYVDSPKTAGELRQWIKDGKLKVSDDYEDDEEIYFWVEMVRLDSGIKRDQKGYKAAMKAMTKAASDVKDQIVVFGAEKGLEALNAFKAKTFS